MYGIFGTLRRFLTSQAVRDALDDGEDVLHERRTEFDEDEEELIIEGARVKLLSHPRDVLENQRLPFPLFLQNGEHWLDFLEAVAL